jgi:predicted DNA binding protein/DNA-binding NarL/FixJ family response regulator
MITDTTIRCGDIDVPEPDVGFRGTKARKSSLDMDTETQSSETEKMESRSSAESRGTGKVLVVDDERNLADLYTTWLSDAYEVVTAYDGEEAIEKYDEEVDVVLLDRRMPGMSGEEVLKEVKRLPGDCVAGMVTAVEPEEDILSMDFEDYVQKPVSDDELLGVVDDLITLSEYDERLRRSYEIQAKSAALNLDELAEAVSDGEPSRREMFESLADTVSSVCSPEAVEVWSFGEGTPSLELREGVDDERDTYGTERLAWEAYSDDSAQTEFDEAEDAPTEHCLANRIGEHGVVLVYTRSDDEPTEDEKASVKSAAVMTGASLDTARYRKEAEQNRRLSDEYRQRKDELEKLDRMVRETSVAVLEAKTRAEIERTACRKLTDSSLVEFAWIGEHVESSDEMDPVCANDEGYMEAMASAGEPEEAKEVANDGETRVVEGIGADPPLEPWEETAVRNGFGSVVRVPVRNRASSHGVMSVYTEASEVDSRTVSAVEDIGTVVGHALDSYEKTASLVSSETTEVRLRVGDESFPPVRFASEVDGEARLEGVAPTERNGQKTYIEVSTEERDTKKRVEKTAERLPSVRSVSHVASRDGVEEFRFTGDAFFLQDALKHGATPVDMEATPEYAEMTLRLSGRDSASSFVSMVEKEYDEVELVSTRDKDAGPKTRTAFTEELKKKLTERQMETVQTAYYSGYFNSPQDTTGREIADEMGVSQPTVTENIKASERTVFGELFDD